MNCHPPKTENALLKMCVGKGPSQPEKTARGVLTNLFFGQKKAAKKTENSR
jgi:hypothetical protein